jgi:hypothetical protein
MYRAYLLAFEHGNECIYLHIVLTKVLNKYRSCKHRPRIKVLLFYLLMVQNAFAQLSYNGPFTLKNNFSGKAAYGYKKVKNDSMLMHGLFNFSSNIYQIDTSNSVVQVNIKGNYLDGFKNGIWNYEQNEYKVGISRINNLKVDAYLDGVQKNLLATYKSGTPHGRWIYTSNTIAKSKKVGTGERLEAQFKSGYAVDDFSYSKVYKGSDVSIVGRFDESGRMHGKWKLQYHENQSHIVEERIYQEGFLIQLSKRDKDSDSLLLDLFFDDVKVKLSAIEQYQDQQIFKKGDSLFSVLFNDGYRRNDLKITAQIQGNMVLEEVFSSISDVKLSIFGVPGFDHPKIGYTRRFQYVYPASENVLLEQIDSIALNGLELCDSLLNSTTLKINKQKNDTLAFLYKFLELAQQKFFIINEEVLKLKSTRFDYENRSNYYANGVLGLVSIDTVKYEILGKKFLKPVHFNHVDFSADSVVYYLLYASKTLQTDIDSYLNPVIEVLAAYQRERIVDSLDRLLLQLVDSASLLFIGTRKIEIDEISEKIVSHKPISNVQLDVFTKISQIQLERLIIEYTNTIDVDQKVARGDQICQLVLALIESYDKLGEIASMPVKFDKAFTRKSPNPFFEREIITRIKPSIYAKGGERLFEYFVQNIGKATTRIELEANIELVYKLESKLLYMAASDLPETNRLNTRLRRENQPERIRRLFGL